MKKDRSHWIVRKCESFEEMERIQIQDWQAVSAADRMAEAWELVKTAWRLKERDPDELRLQRIVTSIKRGER